MTAWVPAHPLFPVEPMTIGEVVEHSIGVTAATRHDQIDALRVQIDETTRVLKIVCDLLLNEQQEQVLAKSLGYKQAK